MKIDASKLKEVNIPKVIRIAPNERFYAVPNAKGYYLSDYGRLFYGNKRQPIIYIKGQGLDLEYYHIKFDNSMYAGLIRIDHLIALTFRPDEFINRLINPHMSGEKTRWRVPDLHIINSASEMVNYIQSKIDGVDPSYAGAYEKHGFINRGEYTKEINKVIQSAYYNAKNRATNAKVKKRNPQYADVTMCDEWLKSIKPFADWFLAHDYYYPEPLELDKDLMSFGTSKMYSPETCCRLPQRINKLFEGSGNKYGLKIQVVKRIDGTKYYLLNGKKNQKFNDYYDALNHVRQNKANEIRRAVKEEREKGFMPEYLLEKMSKWADLTEMGLIKMWEPDTKVLLEEGII